LKNTKGRQKIEKKAKFHNADQTTTVTILFKGLGGKKGGAMNGGPKGAKGGQRNGGGIGGNIMCGRRT